jgi:LPS export ABC transporter protein LptC
MIQENNVCRLLPGKNVFFLCVAILLTTISCKEQKKVKVSKPYKGPSMVVYHLEALLTDSAQPKILMKAPRQIEYENGDRLFPDGVNIEFFGEKNKKSSILTARKGKYSRAKDIYTVTQDVVIINQEEGKKLNTEELHWNPGKKKIYTDKFVKIETREELLTGTGLESSEDFDNYRILKVKGVFPMKK